MARVLPGTWLGSTFRRERFLSAGRLVMATTVTSLLLVALCTAFAARLALVSDFPWDVLVLGAAPGSITEMALTARFAARRLSDVSGVILLLSAVGTGGC